MPLKQILTSNLEDSKIGKIIIFIILSLIIFVVVADQFSLENKCRRKVAGLIRLLPAELKGSSMVLESVQQQEIEKCVKESK